MVILIIALVQCGEKKDGKKPGTNTPPVVSKVILEPLTPTVQSEIKARILSLDKDNDPITYEISWFVNGRKIGEGMLFSYEEVQKGDRIYAEVVPSDGKEKGKPVQSNEVVIAGLPPRILSLQSAPESVFVTTPQVVVTALAEDPDKDSVRLIVHWVVKDEAISDTSNTINLRNYDLAKNDVITGSAFVDDGEFRSEPFLFELVIANAPPVFSTKIDSVTCRPDSIYYKLPIFDPDGDPITYDIIDGPDGVVVDQASGVIHGNAGDVNTFEVHVRATDSDGAYMEAKFTLTSPSTQ
jgi:hypothetical protein